MKVKLLVDQRFEYSGIRKTLWKVGMILDARHSYKFRFNSKKNVFEMTDEVDGYWITTGERTINNMELNKNLICPGQLYETKCFLSEAEVYET